MEHWKNLTDEKLVEYIREKNPEAYGEIMERYQKKLARYAFSLVRDEMEAADIAQNAFIKAFVNLKSFNSKLKFSSWIYRIVHNEAMDVFTKKKREVALTEDMNFESKEDITDDFFKKQENARVKECFSRLPVIYAEPLALYFMEEKSYEEISDILRLPIGTVGTRINRAKMLMKKICQKN